MKMRSKTDTNLVRILRNILNNRQVKWYHMNSTRFVHNCIQNIDRRMDIVYRMSVMALKFLLYILLTARSYRFHNMHTAAFASCMFFSFLNVRSCCGNFTNFDLLRTYYTKSRPKIFNFIWNKTGLSRDVAKTETTQNEHKGGNQTMQPCTLCTNSVQKSKDANLWRKFESNKFLFTTHTTTKRTEKTY